MFVCQSFFVFDHWLWVHILKIVWLVWAELESFHLDKSIKSQPCIFDEWDETYKDVLTICSPITNVLTVLRSLLHRSEPTKKFDILQVTDVHFDSK